MSERWLPIPGFPDYEVSDMGRVKSYKRSAPYVMKPSTVKGYPCVRLRTDSAGRDYRVHQLVILAFVGPCPEGMEVCHNDSNRANNHLSNLRYDTHQANIQEAASLGRMGPTPKFLKRMIASITPAPLAEAETPEVTR